MSVSEMFADFLENLKISNSETISDRYGELTSALNKQFRNTNSSTANTLQVGSFGRGTAIHGISDLDMLYIMPSTKWDDYNKEGGQRKLLEDAKAAIRARYATTKIRVDRLVVTVTYTNFHVEVQPVFEQEDQSYKYPDTENGGGWKITKPRAEMTTMVDMDEQKNGNLRRLCKMARAWKNHNGVGMGGLLIDTLAYNFLDATNEYDQKSFACCHEMSRGFFKYLSELPDQKEFAAPGSRQRVKVKRKFQSKAQTARNRCGEAIEADGQKNVNEKWKKIYGRPFPANRSESKSLSSDFPHDDTEEFIEDRFPVDIREEIVVDCEVTQNGFRPFRLLDKLVKRFHLKRNKSLRFEIKENTTSEPYDIYWKVLNRGQVAREKNLIRGQITKDLGSKRKNEKTDFNGDHIVECYCAKEDVVVARGMIRVPIDGENGSDE